MDLFVSCNENARLAMCSAEKPFSSKLLEVIMKKLHFLGISFLLFVVIGQNAYAAAREWELDQAHSNIYFSVGHIYSKIHGHFNEFK